MTHEVDSISALLNGLIETCLDGEHGYRAAATEVKDTAMESVFTQYAEQRAKFVKELRAEVARIGGTPAESGSVTGAVHRGWISVKSALTGADAAAVVAACETGEESAVAAYDRAGDSTVSGETRSLIQRQAGQVREALNHVKRLEVARRSTI